jgi:hypothetical protein
MLVDFMKREGKAFQSEGRNAEAVEVFKEAAAVYKKNYDQEMVASGQVSRLQVQPVQPVL